MSLSFAQKLAVTAVLLGCSTRKELCARFRAVNPATEFDLERSFKWMQGKALPRSTTIYDDWARLIGTARGGVWLAGCSVDAFLGEVCGLFQADAAEVRQRAARFLGERAGTGGDGLSGDFVSYSWAWSPFRQGWLIRGTLALRPAPAGRVAAVYTEQLDRQEGVFRGNGMRTGRTLLLALSGDEGEHMAQSLLLSGKPSDCFCGMMQGFTLAGTTPEVAGSRIVGMRLPQGGRPQGMGYLRPEAGAVAGDLEGCGFAPALAARLGVAVLGFLRAGIDAGGLKVTGEDMTEVARALAGGETRAPGG